ncbi:MAG: pyridoxal-phosphate dependent enzyme, partial [Bacteroidota bacterium]
MATAYTYDVLDLWHKANSEFKSAEPKSKLLKTEEYYKNMADHLQAEVLKYDRERDETERLNLRPLAGSTLYRKLHFDLKKDSIGEDCRYDENTLNVLCMYVYQMPYSKRFLLLDRHVETPQEGTIERVWAEFPIHQPAYPATPTLPVSIPGLENAFVKCENYNYTGTHKDRMALEVASFYPEYVRDIQRGKSIVANPNLSLITSGCAGIAIQSIFRALNLPNLHVLTDEETPADVQLALRNLGCEVFVKDLDAEELSTQDVLRLTHNEDGFDLTFTKEIEYVKLKYYDWLSFEIINEAPDYCFIPFGSGDLMVNVLRRIDLERKLFEGGKSDHRLQVSIHRFRKTRFFGATNSRKSSSLNKLYSKYFSENDNRMEIERIVGKQNVHRDSRLVDVEEEYVEEALAIAESNYLKCEPSGIAGLALFLQMRDELLEKDPDLPNKKVLFVNTGKLKTELFQTI